MFRSVDYEECFESTNTFDVDFKIAADFKFLAFKAYVAIFDRGRDQLTSRTEEILILQPVLIMFILFGKKQNKI